MSKQPEKQPEQEFKCVTVGDGEVGKTCMLMRYTTNEFPRDYTPTVFYELVVNFMVDGRQFSLRLCDTAGQEAYDRLRPLSYPGASVFLLCFSVTSPTSLENIRDKWYPEVTHYAPHAALILVGTKVDLRPAENAKGGPQSNGPEIVSHQRAKAVAKEIKAVRYMECSALSRVGLKDVFDAAVMVLVKSPKKKASCSLL